MYILYSKICGFQDEGDNPTMIGTQNIQRYTSTEPTTKSNDSPSSFLQTSLVRLGRGENNDVSTLERKKESFFDTASNVLGNKNKHQAYVQRMLRQPI